MQQIKRIEYYFIQTEFTIRGLDAIEKDICYEAGKNYIYGMGKEDIAQELRAHIFSKIGNYDPTKSNFRTWAIRVMKNKIIDLSRKKKDKLDSEQRTHIDNTGSKFM